MIRLLINNIILYLGAYKLTVPCVRIDYKESPTLSNILICYAKKLYKH